MFQVAAPKPHLHCWNKSKGKHKVILDFQSSLRVISWQNKFILQLQTHTASAVLWLRGSEWIKQNKPQWSHK